MSMHFFNMFFLCLDILQSLPLCSCNGFQILRSFYQTQYFAVVIKTEDIYNISQPAIKCSVLLRLICTAGTLAVTGQRRRLSSPGSPRSSHGSGTMCWGTSACLLVTFYRLCCCLFLLLNNNIVFSVNSLPNNSYHYPSCIIKRPSVAGAVLQTAL